MKVSLIAGARPNFMKIAPLVRAFSKADVETRLIHTGQHYDHRMSQTFFDELHIPHPDINLEVGSGTHIWQISEVMRKLEGDFTEHRPDMVIVVGDVNSTVAASITATKLGICLAHVEAGLRSFDRDMPEEINRLLTDSIADLLFASEPAAVDNLRAEGVAEHRMHYVGNVMIDTLMQHLAQARDVKECENHGCEAGKYAVLTLHRPSNVDSPEHLESILRAVHQVSQDLPILLPLHPRTRSRMEEFGFFERPELCSFKTLEPLGYHSMLSLMDSARVVLTDSGGVQEETTALKIPCVTLRENTERPVTITEGSNRLVGWKTQDILAGYQEAMAQSLQELTAPKFWDGHASDRIAEICLQTV